MTTVQYVFIALAASACLVITTTLSPEDTEKKDMIVKVFNETQLNLRLYEEQVQEWFSSLNDTFFLDNTMSDILTQIRQKHTETANRILKVFEEDPSSLVVVQLAAGGRHVTAQLLLRERMINWFKNMMPKHEEIAVLREREAQIRRQQATADDRHKAKLVKEERDVAAERLGQEQAIAMANRERLESQQDSFWRDLFENLGQLIVIISRIWKMLTERYAGVKGYE